MTLNPQQFTPEITQEYFDESLGGRVVHVEPYRDKDTSGNEVEVHRFFDNGPFVTAMGAKIKKDGTPGKLSVTVNVRAPHNVRRSIGGHHAPKDDG